MTIPRLRLPIAILALSAILSGCAPRQESTGPVNVRASYELIQTDAPTIPRCYHGKRPMGATYTRADIDAVHAMHIGTIEQSDVVTGFRPGSDVIAIEPWMPRTVLLHEVCHAGQVAGGHADHWGQEAGAMLAEVAELQAEGWSDDRIRELSPNNAQTPAWIFAWIHTMGPQFTGTPADIPVAYAWGKSAAVYVAVSAIVNPTEVGMSSASSK